MRLSRREPNTLASRVRQLRSVYWLTPAFVAACLLLALADSVIWGAERAAGRPRHTFLGLTGAGAQSDLFRDLVFFNDPEIVSRLGCPNATAEKLAEVTTETNFTCFYRFTSRGPLLSSKYLSGPYRPEQDCTYIRRPLPADWGKPWCIRIGRKPTWLDKEVPQPWPLIEGTTLITGHLLGPNPTHQLNLHFYHLYRWMKQVKIPMGTLNMVFDALTRDMAPTVGEYGNGLAAAFGNNHGVLANLPSVTAFEQVKFSVGGGFQFDMNGFQSDTPILCDYLHMAEEIKAQYGLNPMQEADAKRVVVAVRKENESRRLENAGELTTQLAETGWNVTQVTLGSLPFKQQIQLMSDAKVLIGVHGSDLVSFLFMPFRAVVIEILPLVMGTPLLNPELANQARNYGKIHRQYFSPYNATLVTDPETGQPIQAMPVHQAKLVRVHVPDLIASMQGLIQMSNAMMFYELDVGPGAPGGESVCRYHRPVPHGLLYGCQGINC